MIAKCLHSSRSRVNLFLILLLLFLDGITSTADTNGRTRRLRKGKTMPGKVTSLPPDWKIMPGSRRAQAFTWPNQVESFEPGEAPAAFEKCYSNLQRVSDDDKLYQPEYLEFLDLMTDGEVSYPDFRQLPALFVLVFYANACTNGFNCVDETPYISLVLEGVSSGLVPSFCYTIMQNIYTEATVTFEYTIRYNSQAIDEDQVASCLEIATENLLLDNFGCPYGDEEQRRALASGQHEEILSPLSFSSVQEEMDRERDLMMTEGLKELLIQQMSMDTDDCRYAVDVTIDSITDFGKCIQASVTMVVRTCSHFALCFATQSAYRQLPQTTFAVPWFVRQHQW